MAKVWWKVDDLFESGGRWINVRGINMKGGINMEEGDMFKGGIDVWKELQEEGWAGVKRVKGWFKAEEGK